MPIVPPRSAKRRDETERVLEHYRKTIHRVLDFLGYTIDDVVNDPRKREHVRRAYLISLRIGRDLDRAASLVSGPRSSMSLRS